MPLSWKHLAHQCLEVQLKQLHEGKFDPQTAMQSSPESSWNSFVCSTAFGLLHHYVDSLYFTSQVPTEFDRLEKVFLDTMYLDINPEIQGDRLYLFGQCKPCISLSRLQQSFEPHRESADRNSVKNGKGLPEITEAVACHEVKLCVLLAALAICQMSLAPQYARGFCLMVKAILGEARAAGVHSTNEATQKIAHVLGADGKALDMIDSAFSAMAQHSLSELSESGRGSTTPRSEGGHKRRFM